MADYQYRRTVTIDKNNVPNTDQTNFPVLFSGTYPYLATVVNGGKVEHASGFDIIFTSDAAGAIKLDHEIETYNAITGAVTFWVRVPTVSTTTNTVIYLWYGYAAITTSQENVAGVWDTNFKAVLHLKDGTTLSAVDSTSNANHGTVTAAVAGAGQVNGAASFNGTTAKIVLAAAASLNGFTAGEIEFWFNPTSTLNSASNPFGFANHDFSGIGKDWLIAFNAVDNNMVNAGTGKIYFQPQQAGASAIGTTTTSWTAGTWYHIRCRIDGTTKKIFVNGVEEISGADTSDLFDSARGGTELAKSTGVFGPTLEKFFPGLFDEIRISNIARSADWGATGYNNQSSPSTFYAVEVLSEDTPPGGKVISWLNTKGAGPWAFTPQPDKLGYLNNPRWTKTPASAVDHEPCGYWWKCR